jgi:F-type H+-transporting ATPase subunit b
VEAERLRDRLAEEARREVDATRRRWEDELQGERETFLRDIRRQAAEQFVGLARRALGDLANAELETQVAEEFLARLGALDEAARRATAISARAAGHTATVESAFELSAAVRSRITGRLHEVIDPDLIVGYARSAELSCGIAVKVGSQTLLWSLDSYLDGLERALAETLAAPGAHAEGDA